MTLNQLLPTPRAEKHSPQSREDFTPNLAARIQELTFSPQDFPASQPAPPDKEKARQMTDGSGLRCLRRFKNLNHAGSCWKTSLVSCLLKQEWYSSSVALTWKLKGTKFNRCLFQLAVSERRTEGNGCGLLLKTPSAVETVGGTMEIRPGANAHYKLRDQIAMLPTPTCGNDYRDTKMKPSATEGRHGKSIAGILSMLPTPRAEKHSPQSREDFTPNLAARVEGVGTSTGMKLHSDFVCHLMGYPVDWLDV